MRGIAFAILALGCDTLNSKIREMDGKDSHEYLMTNLLSLGFTGAAVFCIIAGV